jgi:hypothetical protein
MNKFLKLKYLINISNFAGEEGNRADKARGEGSTENGI